MSANQTQVSDEYDPLQGYEPDTPSLTRKRGRSTGTNENCERYLTGGRRRGVSERDNGDEDVLVLDAMAAREGSTSGSPSKFKSVVVYANALPRAEGRVVSTSDCQSTSKQAARYDFDVRS